VKKSRVFEVDADQPSPPDGLLASIAEGGEIIALLAEEGPRGNGWAARFAVELARTWSEGEARVVLADCDVSAASLHELVGEPNDEGITDLIVFGASAERVVRSVEDGDLRFVPSGTVVADPDGALADARWSMVLSDFRSSGDTLLLYLPAELPGAAMLSGHADRLIQLAPAPPEGRLDKRTTVVHAEAEYARSQAARVGAEDESDGSEGSESGPGDTAEGTEPEPPTEKPTPPKVSRAFLIALLLVLVIALFVMAWLGLIEIPGISLSSLPLAPRVLSSRRPGG
jgi:hypothetical protein